MPKKKVPNHSSEQKICRACLLLWVGNSKFGSAMGPNSVYFPRFCQIYSFLLTRSSNNFEIRIFHELLSEITSFISLFVFSSKPIEWLEKFVKIINALFRNWLLDLVSCLKRILCMKIFACFN